ncbi:hypothetical protein CEXT_439631 [Caerostris extrusa]|uniref:Uncharacterized protein n=1 Tax=Caerostris extrusa TaxID=172846 RepID=A0AAV4R6B9_CAEEX|nr:hypothetical protein CEXT_439631 [Caerostris extrusa]
MTTTPTEVIVIMFSEYYRTPDLLVNSTAKARFVIYWMKALVLIIGLRHSINAGIGFPESVGNTRFEKGGKITREGNLH